MSILRIFFFIKMFFLFLGVPLALAHDATATRSQYIETIFVRAPLSTSRFSVNETTLPIYSCKFIHKTDNETGTIYQKLLKYRLNRSPLQNVKDVWNGIYIQDTNGNNKHSILFEKSFTNQDYIKGKIDGISVLFSKDSYEYFRNWLSDNRTYLFADSKECR